MMWNQADVAKQYTLNAMGCVSDPGKFEGEHWSTVAFYDLSMNGFADETRVWSEDESEDVFILDDALRAHIGAQPTEHAFELYITPQGFVIGQTIDLDTYNQHRDEYEKHCEQLEQDEQDD